MIKVSKIFLLLIVTAIAVSCSTKKQYSFTLSNFERNEKNFNIIYNFCKDNPDLYLIARYYHFEVMVDGIVNLFFGDEYGDFMILMRASKREFFLYEDIEADTLLYRFTEFCDFHNISNTELIKIVHLLKETYIQKIVYTPGLHLKIFFGSSYGLIYLEENESYFSESYMIRLTRIKNNWYFFSGQ